MRDPLAIKQAVPRIYSSCLKSLTVLWATIALPDNMERLVLPFVLLVLALDRHLVIENLALQQQLAAMRRRVKPSTAQTRYSAFADPSV